MVNAHPDRWFCGNDRAGKVLARCVDYVLERHDPACLTAVEVADHVRAQVERGALMTIAGEPSLRVPRHAGPIDRRPGLLNPLTMKPSPFLARASA